MGDTNDEEGAAAGCSAFSFSTFSRIRRSSSGMSHFDSFVSVYEFDHTLVLVYEIKNSDTYVVVVLPTSREILFPFRLVQSTLRAQSDTAASEANSSAPQTVFSVLQSRLGLWQ